MVFHICWYWCWLNGLVFDAHEIQKKNDGFKIKNLTPPPHSNPKNQQQPLFFVNSTQSVTPVDSEPARKLSRNCLNPRKPVNWEQQQQQKTTRWENMMVLTQKIISYLLLTRFLRFMYHIVENSTGVIFVYVSIATDHFELVVFYNI